MLQRLDAEEPLKWDVFELHQNNHKEFGEKSHINLLIVILNFSLNTLPHNLLTNQTFP